MVLKRMEHVGVVVDDLPAARAFFVALGLEQVGEGTVSGEVVDRVVGLSGVRSEIVMLKTPDGHFQLELCQFASPTSPVTRDEPANVPGLRHILFVVEDIDAMVERLRGHGATPVGGLEQYEDSYRLCYLRGPAGIIVELAEELK